MGLPSSYPLDAEGRPVPKTACQPIGQAVKDAGLKGVLCRSAASSDGRGTEMAWFPATSRSRARSVWDGPLPYGRWREAMKWLDLQLREQPGLR